MRKQIIAIVAAIGISFAAVAPAKAWYGGWGYGGWGYGGYGAAMLGAGLVGGIIGGAIAQSYAPYGYGYGYGYPYYGVPVYNQVPVAVPVYNAPVYRAPAVPAVRKNIIIKNSPGATVIEEDDIFSGW